MSVSPATQSSYQAKDEDIVNKQPMGERQSKPPAPGPVPVPLPPSQQRPFVNSPRPANCPPGLEYLSQLNQIVVKQKAEIFEAFMGFETKNKYDVVNSMGQQMYKASEETDCCTRQCCGPARPFEMTIVDNFGMEVIHLNRPLRCSSCLFPCCLQILEVSSPPGSIIGTIEQNWSCLYPKYTVKDAGDNPILKIEGPFCTWSCFGSDVAFKVMSLDGQVEVGKISKEWAGIGRELFTDADIFGVNFPLDLDVRAKATLLGAVFLIDFMFFEKKGKKSAGDVDAPGMVM